MPASLVDWLQLVGTILALAGALLAIRRLNVAVEAKGIAKDAYDLASRLERRAKRTAVREGYVEVVDAIIELKSFVRGAKPLLAFIESDPNVAAELAGGVAKDADDLLAKCLFFFHLEKVYHRIRHSEVSGEELIGLRNEMKTWLVLKGMREFFESYCDKEKCYTPEFLAAVRQFYREGSNVFPLPTSGKSLAV